MLSFDGGYRSCQVDNMKSRDDVTRARTEKLNQMNFCSGSSIPVFCLEISKWRKKDISFISFEYITLRFLFSVVKSLQFTVTIVFWCLCTSK